RLADALESSREGVVVADADGRLALANAQAADFLGIAPESLRPGMPITDIAAFTAKSAYGRTIQSIDLNSVNTSEVRLADGRWLRISRSATREQGFIVVCSDITMLKEQEAVLKETNLRLDAALDNMTHGLCMFNAEQRLIVCNATYVQMYGLTEEHARAGTTLQCIDNYRMAIGTGAVASAEQAAAAAAQAVHEPSAFTQELMDGRVIAVSHRPMTDAGCVPLHHDL